MMRRGVPSLLIEKYFLVIIDLSALESIGYL